MATEEILIVEDEGVLALGLRRQLEQLGYTVCGVASYGEEAVSMAIELRPDLVLMDIQLRGEMDGIQAAEQIRSQLDIPVIYLTAYVDDDILQRAKVTGPYGYVSKPYKPRDLHATIDIALYKHHIDSMVLEDKQKFRGLVEHFQYLATHDALTGLPNRVLFKDRLEHAMDLAKRQNTAMAVLFLDLDGFKIVNDTVGHDKGDEVLREVADRLSGSIRGCDTVARLGGDEFGIVLESLSSKQGAAIVAEKVMASMSRPFEIAGHEFALTVSIGICACQQEYVDAQTILKRADSAMYEMKRAGKSGYRFFEEAPCE